MTEKLSWREKFSASLLLLIGIGFAAMQFMSIVSSKANGFIAVDERAIMINRLELVNDLKTYSTIFFALIGSILLFRQKRLGWIIGVPFLVLFTFLSGFFVYSSFDADVISRILLWIVFAALLFSLGFLVIPSARRKYKVGKYTYLPTLVFLMALCAMYYFLQ